MDDDLENLLMEREERCLKLITDFYEIVKQASAEGKSGQASLLFEHIRLASRYASELSSLVKESENHLNEYRDMIVEQTLFGTMHEAKIND